MPATSISIPTNFPDLSMKCHGGFPLPVPTIRTPRSRTVCRVPEAAFACETPVTVVAISDATAKTALNR